MKSRWRIILVVFAVLLLGMPAQAFAQTQISTFGSSGLDHSGGMTVAPDGDLIFVGAVHQGVELPGNADRIRFLGEESDGDHRGFVARYTPDGSELRWLALFPPETFVPSVVAADEDVIALGGDPLTAMRTHFPTIDSQYQRGVVVVLSGDGREVIAARGGPPNTPHGIRMRDGEHRGYQAGITGIDIHEGLVYVTGSTSGQGQGAYIVRYEAQTLDGIDFPDRPVEGRTWAIDLHRSAPDLQEALIWRYDRENENAEFHQGDCRINLSGNRRGGQVIVTEYDGGTIFGSFDIQYDFNCTNRWFPAFDAGIAAWTLDGELKWATNGLDQMVSEPDQGPQAMAWDPVNQRLIVALWQHGSNVARLPGSLIGDTGNISIGWVGAFDPGTGEVQDAWYQHAVRQESNGSWTETGGISGWPRNSGNNIQALAVDGLGQVIVAGTGGNQMYTTPDGLQDWPKDLWGGHATITVLSPDLQETVYATVLRRVDLEGTGGSAPGGIAINQAGLFVFGRTDSTTFLEIEPEIGPWNTGHEEGRNTLFFARIGPSDLPFVPEAPDPNLEPSTPNPGPGDGQSPGDQSPGDQSPGDQDGDGDGAASDGDGPLTNGNGPGTGREVEGCQCSFVGSSPGERGGILLLLLVGLLVLRKGSPQKTSAPSNDLRA